MDVLQSLPANRPVPAPSDVPSGEEAEKRVLYARIKELKGQVEELQTRVRGLEALLNPDGNEQEGPVKNKDTKIDSATQDSLQGNLGGRVKSEEEEETKQSLVSARKSTRTIKKRKMFDPTADEPMPRRRRSSVKVKAEDGEQKYIKVDDDGEQEEKPHVRSRRLKVEVVMPLRSRPRVKRENPIDVDTSSIKAENPVVKILKDEGSLVGVLKADASAGLEDVRADTVPVLEASNDMHVDVSPDQPNVQQEPDHAHQPNMELVAAYLESPVVTNLRSNLVSDEIDPNDINPNDIEITDASVRSHENSVKKESGEARRPVSERRLQNDFGIKIKDEEKVSLDFATIQSRIATVGADPFPVTLDFAIQNVTVTRLFMSHVYGGSPRNTIPIIGKKKRDEHGLDHFMFVKYKYNPDAPKFPGQTALWSTVTSVAEQGWPHEYRTFVCRKTNEWLYVGQYRLAAAVPLSADEWKNQDELVKNTWCSRILQRNTWPLYTRASIVLWKELGREPTKAEIEAKIAKAKDKFQTNLSVQDIRDAYDSGRQTLSTLTMKCVAYDEDFQRSLAQAFPKWNLPTSKGKKPSRNAHPKKIQEDEDQVTDESDTENDL